MAIQHPFTSSSHWRIPTQDVSAAHHARLGGNARARALAGRLWRYRNAVVAAALALVTLGGVFVAPLAALGALAALLLPGSAFARPLAAPLIAVAVIWLTLAILCAHACHASPTPDGRDPAGDA